ncbi:MAG TPA: FAD-binding protein, partial [Polyangiaceae bacterium]
MSEWKPKGLSRRHFLGLSFGAVVATGVGCSTDDGSKSGQQGTSGVCSANGAKLEELAEVVATDVLIIGGGVGGLTAAVKAKEANPSLDVLIVEKQTSGWAGKAPKIGGFLAFLAPNADADKFMDFQVRNCGFYLNDQQMLMRYVQSTYQAIEQFGEWGVTLARNPDGNLFSLPDTWAREYSFSLVDIDMMLPIRTRARELGTRILNKIHVVDLLKQGNRVVGAVGFHIVTGQFYIIKAKATVLANGSCGYKVRRYWVAGTGDGVAAAFRAGAEMRNAEYGNLYGHLVYQDTEGGFLDYTYLVNALGENLAQKYVPNLEPAGVFLPLKMALGMEKEVAEGRGPICFAPPAGAPAMAALPSLPKLSVWTQRVADKETKYGPLPDANREIA